MPINSLNDIGKKTRQKCLSKYNWDYTSKLFENLFDSIDISKKLDWSVDQRQINTSYTIKNNTCHRQIIYDIIDNIICEPFLKNTNFIEELIKNASDGYVQHGQQSIPFNRSSYIKILEMYMKNKVSLEILRTQPNTTLSEKLKDFFEYSKK
jgi:hypothetical protein